LAGSSFACTAIARMPKICAACSVRSVESFQQAGAMPLALPRHRDGKPS
jgi:hypothetical protein